MRSISAGAVLRITEEEKVTEVDVAQFRMSRNITKPDTLAQRMEEHVNAKLESPYRCCIHVTSIDPLNYSVMMFQYSPETQTVVDGKVVTTANPLPDRAEWIAGMKE